MRYVNLGGSGTKVSPLALGCMDFGATASRAWAYDEEQSRVFIRRALELGINYFDTADIYADGNSEPILGRALRDFAGGRERVVIATKVGLVSGPGPNDRGLSRKHIRHAIDTSLKRLNTDYVDLYQIHRLDPDTEIEEVLETLTLLVRAGKVNHIGASSMPAWQFAQLVHTARRYGFARPVTMQNYYNLVYREEEREMVPLCRAERIGLVPWSPLARGLLTGNRRKGTVRAKHDRTARNLYTDADDAIVQRVADVAAKLGVSPAQVALAWLRSKPEVTAPIIGVSRPEHLDDAVASLSLVLTPKLIEALEAPYVPHSVMAQGWNTTPQTPA